MTAAVKGPLFEVGLNDSYPGTIQFGTDDGTNGWLKDGVLGKKTLSELWDYVAPHSIGSHSDLGTDFATQYFNEARLEAYLGTAANAGNVALSGDVGGNGDLAAHVADSAIHTRVAKFVIRVAKAGGHFTTVQAALDSIPTGGADAPSSTNRYLVLVEAGVFAETVTVAKDYVTLRGRSRNGCRITQSGNTVPTVHVTGNGCAVENLTVENTSGSSGAVALAVGTTTPATPTQTDFMARQLDCLCPSSYAGIALHVRRSVLGAVRVQDCYLEAFEVAAYLEPGGVVGGGEVDSVVARLTGTNKRIGFHLECTGTGDGKTFYVSNCQVWGQGVVPPVQPYVVRVANCTAYVSSVLASPDTVVADVGTGNTSAQLYLAGVCGIVPALPGTVSVDFLETTPVRTWGDFRFGNQGASGADFYLYVGAAPDVTRYIRWGGSLSPARWVFSHAIEADGSLLTALNAGALTGNVAYARMPTGSGTWNFGSNVALQITGSGNSPVLFPGATSSSSYLGVGAAGKIYDDGATLYFIGRSYYALGSTATQTYLNGGAGRLGFVNGSVKISAYSNETDNLIAYYNATAGNRSCWVGTRLLVAETAAAVTSGAKLQVVNSTAADVVASLKAAASQTGDLLQLQNSSGTVLAKVDSAGNGLLGGLGFGTVVSGNQYPGVILYCQKAGGDTVNVGEWLQFGSTAMSSGKPYVKRYDVETELDFAGVAVAVSGNDVTVMRFGVCQAYVYSANVGVSIVPDHGGGNSTFYNGDSFSRIGFTGNGAQVAFGTALEAMTYTGTPSLKWVLVDPKFTTQY